MMLKWKRPAALLLAAAMIFTMSGVPASAVEPDVSAVSGSASAECICETHCEQGAVNPDCPVCAAEDADLSACLGKEAAVLSVQAMINALPDEPTEENAEDVSTKLGEIDEAMAALGDEERAALDLTQYQAAIAALVALAAAQGEIALYADDANKPKGEGTEEDPYQITSTDEMEWFRNMVNAGETGICAELMNDLKFKDKTGWTWTPIGNGAHGAYTGTFNGNGCKISMDYATAPSDMTKGWGLFGSIGNGGKVQDLDVYFKNFGWKNNAFSISESGMLTAYNSGIIERCTAMNGNINVSNGAGLLVYQNDGTIQDCLTKLGAVIGGGDFIGGIAYKNNKNIRNCFFNGGYQSASLSNHTIAADAASGTIANCYYPSGRQYTDSTKGVTGVAQADAQSGKLTVMLNNGGDEKGSKVDPWRIGSSAPILPSLKKTDSRVSYNSTTRGYDKGDPPHMHGDVEFTKVTALSDITADGNYYISGEIKLDSTWTVKKKILLCLDGQTITAPSGVPAIEIKSGGSLTLVDGSKNGGGKITGGATGVTLNGGAFTMQGGEISGNTVGVRVRSGALTLSGKAKITDNSAADANVKQNILLAANQKIHFDSLDPSAKFGISVENQKDLSDPVAVTDATGGQYFGQLVADGFKDNGVGFELYLSDDGKTVMLGKQSAHTHCICGGRNTNLGHTSHSDVTFQPWRETDKLPTSGNYYLTRNVTLTSSASLQDVNVCLNGYTVTLSDVGRIMSSGTTQLTDCSVGGKLESYSGKANGGVAISNGNTFCLYGGTFNGVKVEIGQTGGGTFNMYGGKITGNTKGTVVGQSKISKNTTITINMYGGEISGNHISENQGGGVFVGSGNQFNMYGGTIQNNSAVDGGGVYIAPAKNAYSAGEMTICGDAVIQGNNKAGGVTNNVSLPSGKQITISGELVKNANIGVTTRANLLQGNVNIATATDAGWVVAKNFTSDNSAYDVGLVNDGKTVQLQVHSHQWKYTENGATITAACKAPSCPAPAGGSVTINKPAHTTYGDGQSENATLTENNWQGPAVDEIAITYKKGNEALTSAPTNAGTYTANITLDGATASVKYTIAKAVPKVEDFTFAAPKDLVYNGQAKSAEVKAKDSVKGMGNITVKYYQSETEVEPINAGRYIVKISVEEGTNYATATDLKIGELTISEDTLPEGTGTDKSVTIRYNDTEVKTYTYTDFGFTAAGTFAVKGSVTDEKSVLATDYPTYGAEVKVKLKDSITSVENPAQTVTIPMTFTPAGGNYKPKEVTLTITLADKATDTRTMTVTQADFVYGEGEVDPQVTGVEGTPTFTYKERNKADAAESGTPPTNAGKYTVTAKIDTADTVYTATADFEITRKPLTQDMVKLDETVHTYNGTSQTVTVTVTDGRNVLADNHDYSVSGAQQIPAGTHTVVVTGLENYTGEISKEWKITPAPLTITDATVAAKTYNGKKDATVNSVNFSGLVNSETLTKGDDYTATGEFEDANAGDNKNVTVTVTLKNQNYMLKDGNTFNKTGVKITQAETPAAPTGLYGIKGQKLSTVILPAGWSWVNDDTEMSEAGDKTFTTKYHDAQGNYKDNDNVSVTVAVKNKVDVSSKITFPDGKMTYDPTKVMTYEEATITGIEAGMNPKWTYTYILNTGNGKLNNDGKPIAAGSYGVTAIYEDSKNIGRATAVLLIKKITLTGEPSVVKITEDNKTLEDVKLAGSTGWPTGTIKWVDKETGTELSNFTVVVANKEYKWVFTPNDTANYETLTGTVKLYTKTTPVTPPGGSSGGGGGGGAAPAPVNPDVITVKEDTKDNTNSKPSAETDTTTITKTTVKHTTTETTKNEQGQDVSKTTASVSKDLGDKLLDQAVSNKSDMIEITVKSNETNNNGSGAGTSAADSVKATEVELPKATVNAIAKDTNADLVIKTDNGEVVLDNKTLETIAGAAKGDTVTLVVGENTQLKEAQKPAEKIVGKNGTLFDLTAKIGEKLLHQFEGGKAHVTLPMPEKLKGKDVLVIYIDDNGLCKILNHSVEKIGAEDYIRFTTTHFSTFAVVDKDEAERLIKEQNAAHVKELMQSAKFKVTTTKTSKKSVKVQVTAKSSKTMLSDIKSLGYTVKYQFYRSTKKTAGYKLRKTSSKNSFTNTKGTKGTKYYYKARVLVYDSKKLVAKSALKQCGWGSRTWTK